MCHNKIRLTLTCPASRLQCRLSAKLATLTGFQWLQVICLPLLFAAIGVLAKRLGRRDGDDSPLRNDWAVGTSVSLMTFGKIASDLLDLLASAVVPTTGYTSEIGWWLFGMVCAIFFLIHQDRFNSWCKGPNGTLDKRKHLFRGVLLPDLVSIVIFACYQARKLKIL